MHYERTRKIEQRFQQAIKLIRQNSHSARGLAEAMAVSRPTVHRIVAELKRRGYVIRSVHDECGWKYELINNPNSKKSTNKILVSDETK